MFEDVLSQLAIDRHAQVYEVGAPDGFTQALASYLEPPGMLYVADPAGVVPRHDHVRHVKSLPRGVVPRLAIVFLGVTRPATALRTIFRRLAPGGRLWVGLSRVGSSDEHRLTKTNRDAVKR